jgi:hypothetical protein
MNNLDWVGVAIGLVLAAFVAFVFVALYLAIADDARLKAQCLADGRKEYECESMLRHNTTTVPVFISR